jgi:starch synthase
MAKKPSKPSAQQDPRDKVSTSESSAVASKAKTATAATTEKKVATEKPSVASKPEGTTTPSKPAPGKQPEKPVKPAGPTAAKSEPARPTAPGKAATPVTAPEKPTPTPPKPAASAGSGTDAKAPPGQTSKTTTAPTAAAATTASAQSSKPIVSTTPPSATLQEREAAFVANQPPLPTAETEEETRKLQLLHAVEAQLSRGEPSEEFEPASDWDSLPMTEAESEPYPEAPQEPYAPPSPPPLFIVQITPELAPVAKVGGLADVVFGLANELEIRGNHVEIILPKYDCLRYDHIWGLSETFRDLWVPWFGGAVHCSVYFGFVHGRKCFFIEPHSADNFFNRGSVYGFNDDCLRFAFFTRAAMEFMWKSGKHPDIIHCHDWQTALAPVFLYEIYQHLGMTHPRVCFTIHNFKHQGVTGAPLLHATGLNRPDYYFHYDRMRDNHNPHALNLMKAGVVYSNFVTTVSPRHASEAKDQGQGFGLEPTLHVHHGKYGGVVNGIDYSFWNPEIDPLIPVHYSADSIDGKYANKRALRDRLLLADNQKPIVAFVGRLDPQKGLELIRHAIFNTLQRGGQFVLLGSSPDGQINNYFWSLKNQLNDNPDCHIEIGFNEELSHLIYAGADMMLVPSRFEPCGLTQLIAMRYGTVPVVREIGGLADTVFDKDHSHKPLHERNGYMFRDYDEAGLESALGRAISCYYEFPEHFRDLMLNGMRGDYSWKNPGQDYLNIYHHIRDK